LLVVSPVRHEGDARFAVQFGNRNRHPFAQPMVEGNAGEKGDRSAAAGLSPFSPDLTSRRELQRPFRPVNQPGVKLLLQQDDGISRTA